MRPSLVILLALFMKTTWLCITVAARAGVIVLTIRCCAEADQIMKIYESFILKRKNNRKNPFLNKFV